MTVDESPSLENETSRAGDMLLWPWAQFGWFLTGTAFLLIGLEDLKSRIGLVAPNAGELPILGTLGVLMILAAITCSIPAALVRWKIVRRNRPPIHLTTLRKANFGLLILIFFVTFLSLVIPSIRAGYNAEAKAHVAGPWVEHSFANNSMRLSTPTEWELFADPNVPSSDIRLTDRGNDLHLLANSTPKMDLTVKTLAEFSQHITEILVKEAKDVSVGDIQRGEIDGCQIADRGVQGTFDGVNICCYLRHIEYPDAWVELRFWTTRSRIDGNYATFVRIADTVHRHRKLPSPSPASIDK